MDAELLGRLPLTWALAHLHEMLRRLDMFSQEKRLHATSRSLAPNSAGLIHFSSPPSRQEIIITNPVPLIRDFGGLLKCPFMVGLQISASLQTCTDEPDYKHCPERDPVSIQGMTSVWTCVRTAKIYALRILPSSLHLLFHGFSQHQPTIFIQVGQQDGARVSAFRGIIQRDVSIDILEKDVGSSLQAEKKNEHIHGQHKGFPGGSVVKNLPANAGTRVPPLSWEDPLEKETAIHPSVLARGSHGKRSLAGYSPWGRGELDMTEQISINNC